ncbi:shikimate dehydrogenase [Consotaella salsifontis]|uniref:Shikimate dehydrogenase (NADP(+)) n=1 Tax=Consotaella salsifontis TaxID=1365950 RepID=A0A1T4T4S0_9HYPH|nr:shikimate dehydrogenase [Consotaella salsifontis]SKA35453.1 shikimate dehydrogenase [Consotaella salsifontis]
MTTRAFVTGWPIAHSRSPLIHGFWLREHGIDGAYDRIAVSPEDFSSFLTGLAAAGLAGGNVTIPHKEMAFANVDRRTGDAEAIGAVNTLWFEKGRLVGGNTDAHGFSANLDERLVGWRNAETATVIGAGGAARAIIHALLSAGVARVRVVNRTASRAATLAGIFGDKVSGHGLEEQATLLAQTDLLVNTVPADLSAPLPDLSSLPQSALVTDIVYVPLMTPVLRAAEARGLRFADGVGMLLHQAVPGFERWFGTRPVVGETLRALVLDDLDAEVTGAGG